ncbi:MAG: CoA ester lyase [Chloroflexi bacterium]|nr:CoA ester lyase [Chloroflexota bacterium]
MRIRRALLFMPGDDRHKIEKGAALGVDSIIMDLEDGVALSRKPEARAVVAAALREVDFGRAEKLVRINPSSVHLWKEDMAETVAARPDGYVLPKVESAHEIRMVDSYLAAAETRYDWPVGSIRLLAIIETARGVANLRDIAESAPRLDALIFGAEDLAGSIGAIRTPEGWEVFYARSAVVIHAHAAGLQAVDTPFVDLNDQPGLAAETRRALMMGYTGKLAIHPRQVEPIQAAFTPGAEEVARAKRLIDAHAAHQAAGTGVFELDGKMVDMPMVRAAENVLARARAAGLDTGG